MADENIIIELTEDIKDLITMKHNQTLDQIYNQVNYKCNHYNHRAPYYKHHPKVIRIKVYENMSEVDVTFKITEDYLQTIKLEGRL